MDFDMKRNVSGCGWALLFALAFAPVAMAQADKPLYENKFDQAATGAVPEEFLVIDGGFAVREESGNKFLELPGAPLETFGVLFGPTEQDGIAVSARIFATAKGRRFPAFSVGLGGQGGYRLHVAPAKKRIELSRGDTDKASVPFDWESGQWLQLKLQLRKTGPSEWKVEGKVWPAGKPEPGEWTVSATDTEEPLSGRPSIWGLPFSGTPIRFDDLVVTRVNTK